jgi:hypothetical protein
MVDRDESHAIVDLIKYAYPETGHADEAGSNNVSSVKTLTFEHPASESEKVL